MTAQGDGSVLNKLAHTLEIFKWRPKVHSRAHHGIEREGRRSGRLRLEWESAPGVDSRPNSAEGREQTGVARAR